VEPPDQATPSLTASQKARVTVRPHASLRIVAASCVVLIGLLRPLHGLAQVGPDDGTHNEPRSSAEPSSERKPPRAAVQHYQKGRELYLAGRYREAVVELEAALALDPESPNLLYNLARVYELLGEIDTSISHYKHYRALLAPSETEERARVDGTLQRLEGARTQVPDEEPLTQPPPPELKRGVADATFWGFTTVAAAALVTGGALGIAALNAEKDAKSLVVDDSDSEARRNARILRSDRLALASDLSLLAGAVLGTTAILLFALRQKPVKSPPRVALDFGAGPKGGFLTLRGQL
jgi:tetratricopeptide (TPR) repeat protein